MGIKLDHPVRYKLQNGFVMALSGVDQKLKEIYYVGDEECAALINQPFGANYVDFYKQLGLKGHDGIDWFARTGTCIYAMADGTVMGINDPIGDNRYDSNRWGHITIQHEGGYQTVYGHISDALVRVGDKVRSGQFIGLTGNTGYYTTGPHLHTYLFQVDESGNRLNMNNGYRGGLDHEEFFYQPLIIEKSDDLEKLYQHAKENGNPFTYYWRSKRWKLVTMMFGIEGVTRSQYFNYIRKRLFGSA